MCLGRAQLLQPVQVETPADNGHGRQNQQQDAVPPKPPAMLHVPFYRLVVTTAVANIIVGLRLLMCAASRADILPCGACHLALQLDAAWMAAYRIARFGTSPI
eukprot:CAMPEP_0172728124 /NCGR_PEP_ID=MMETSP1074-20121228/92065_1 /TAXON_ID=2916 /ORGANISM="Ceratium fusus, Strain PA161109" /LENGTH=102 /DNA_ID=CAMNT_0013555339 /DNA_START=536 /DNA_END=844 /DNA_ORIENTATION=-